MRTFFRSLWPAFIPAQIQSSDEITILRERILQSFRYLPYYLPLCYSCCSCLIFWQPNEYGLVAIYSICVILLAAITLVRQMPYQVRAVIALTVFFILGAGSLFVNGISGSGAVILAGYVALSVIFLGTWPGVASAAVTLVTMLGMGCCSPKKSLPLPWAPCRRTQPSIFGVDQPWPGRGDDRGAFSSLA